MSRGLIGFAMIAALSLFVGEAMAGGDCLSGTVWEIDVHINELDMDMPGVMCITEDGDLLIQSVMIPCCSGKIKKIKCEGEAPKRLKKAKLKCDEYTITVKKLKFDGDRIKKGKGRISGGLTFKVTDGQRVDDPCPCR